MENGLVVFVHATGRASISVEINGVKRETSGVGVVAVLEAMQASDLAVLVAFARGVLNVASNRIGA